MKNIVIAAIAALFCMLPGFAVSQTAAPSFNPPIAMLVRSAGTVEYRESANDTWIEAKIKQVLFSKYQIRTNDSSLAVVIMVHTGTRIYLNKKTHIGIWSDNGENETPWHDTVLLKHGELFAKIRDKGQPDNTLEVKTTNVTARSNGGEFFIARNDTAAVCETFLSILEIDHRSGRVKI